MSNRVIRRFRDECSKCFEESNAKHSRMGRRTFIEAHFMRVSIVEDTDIENPERLPKMKDTEIWEGRYGHLLAFGSASRCTQDC